MAIRHVTFVELPVTDQDRALAFYVQQLGFEVATDSGYQQAPGSNSGFPERRRTSCSRASVE